MLKTVIDLETTVTPPEGWVEGKALKGASPSPFLPNNKIVCVGIKVVGGNQQDVHFSDEEGFKDFIQVILNDTELLIAHNMKFDLMWLRECGFIYDGEIYDTMLTEYTMLGGLPGRLSLEECCKRHNLDFKSDILKEYLDQGINVDQIPRDLLAKYTLQDVLITEQLYNKQQELLNA